MHARCSKTKLDAGGQQRNWTSGVLASPARPSRDVATSPAARSLAPLPAGRETAAGAALPVEAVRRARARQHVRSLRVHPSGQRCASGLPYPPVPDENHLDRKTRDPFPLVLEFLCDVFALLRSEKHRREPQVALAMSLRVILVDDGRLEVCQLALATNATALLRATRVHAAIGPRGHVASHLGGYQLLRAATGQKLSGRSHQIGESATTQRPSCVSVASPSPPIASHR